MTAVVVAAPGIIGELFPMLEIATALAHRGHEVTVVTSASFGAEVKSTGLAFCGVPDPPDLDEAAMLANRAGSAASALDHLNVDLRHVFGDAIPGQYRVLQSLLEREPDAVLVANVLFWGAWPAALGAPGRRPRRWVGVAATPLLVSSADTTPFGPAVVAPGQDPAAANRRVNAELAQALEPARTYVDSILRSLGATDSPPATFDALVTLPDATACLTVPGLEFARSDLPESVHLVGLLPLRRPREREVPAWWDEIAAADTVIAVTQGTVANADLSALVEPSLTAFADLDALIVVATGRDGVDLPALPANARVGGFLPFAELLSHADVFVTNGGFGATQHAIAAGVPVIVAGDSEDKPLVAARVARAGVGIDLGTGRPGPEQLRDAMGRLLGDPGYRHRVRALAEVYARHDAVGAIADLVTGEPDDPPGSSETGS